MADSPYDFDVFLGHASEDKLAVRTFARQLKAAGVTVWLDEEQLPPGAQPTLDVPHGMARCRHLAVWISDAWLKKDYTLWELKLFHEARQAGRTVIPILQRPWDTQRLGPYLSERVAIPPETEAYARLWLTVCAVRGTIPGSNEVWSAKGRNLIGEMAGTAPAARARGGNGEPIPKKNARPLQLLLAQAGDAEYAHK